MRVLVVGDVVGRPGRTALMQLLPALRSEHGVDAVVANVENLAHGKGITEKTLSEVLRAGVDVCTSGNHILFKDGPTMLADPQYPVIRPANFPAGTPGRGALTIDVQGEKLLVLNLMGTVFFKDGASYANPFTTVDALLEEHAQDVQGIILDWHAEATSEKVAMGWHLDGRVSAVFGTHTHVPTADLRILPEGTAYRTDLGMTGFRDGILGVEKDIIVHNFLHPESSTAHRWAEDGAAEFHAVLLDIDPTTRKATHVEAIDRTLGA